GELDQDPAQRALARARDDGVDDLLAGPGEEERQERSEHGERGEDERPAARRAEDEPERAREDARALAEADLRVVASGAHVASCDELSARARDSARSPRPGS